MPLAEGTFRIIEDGWIRIERRDWAVGLSNVRAERLLLGLNQVLFRLDGKNILLDTGLGTKWGEGEVGLAGFQANRNLIPALSKTGLEPLDIDLVILSHLHYDHAGGGTKVSGHKVVPTFPNAVYYLQQAELAAVLATPPDVRDDYRREDLEPLIESGQLKIVTGYHEPLPGLELHLAPGHTPGHQVVVARLGHATLFYPGDLVSTRAHANQRVSMSYDNATDILFQNRAFWLNRASEGEWDVVFCHAVRDPVGKLHRRIEPSV